MATKYLSLLEYSFSIILIFIFSSQINAQNTSYGKIDSNKLPVLYSHSQTELLLDNCLEPEKWNSVNKGLNVSVVSTEDVFFRTEVPNLPQTSHLIEKTAWLGERINIELLVWSSDTLHQVNLLLNDFKGSDNNIILKQHTNAYLVRYVLSNFSFNSNEYICGVGPKDSAYLLPDRFEDFDRFELPARTVRPIWISINIPDDAKPGLYNSTINITSTNQSIDIPINIEVLNQKLPPPSQWKFRLDLWQNPWVIADHYHLKPWSEEFKVLLKKHLQLYADAGGKYITTYAVHSPWADNSYYIEKNMIEWIKQKNGSWQFDYKVFDEYIELAHSVGISEAITIYTLVPWNVRFVYYDESTASYVTEFWPVNSEEYKQNINAFLNSLKQHLVTKGWFSKTFLGINENELQQTLNVIGLIKKNSKDWKITYAGYWHNELTDYLDDYSCQINFEPTSEEIQTRTRENKFSTMYVCCIPAKPNNFVYSPPIEGRWLSWYIEAMGYDGFLRWALDSWPADPDRDARHTLWPAGDSFLIYPGGNSCIRFEKLREGIVDFEKIKIIESAVKTSNSFVIKKLWSDFEANRVNFLSEQVYSTSDLAAMISEGIGLLNEIVRNLSNK